MINKLFLVLLITLSCFGADVTVSDSTNCSVSLSCGFTGIAPGTKCTLSCLPDSGYFFRHWETANEAVDIMLNSSATSLIEVNGDDEITPVLGVSCGYGGFDIPVQPAGAEILPTPFTTDTIYRRYDSLISEFPQYVTKDTIGLDESGLYPILKYSFALTNNAPWVLVVSGVHNHEQKGIRHVMRFCKLLCESEIPQIVAMRRKYNFAVLPCPVPWATNVGTNGDNNINDVNINRNWRYKWDESADPNKGVDTMSERETQLIDSVMNALDMEFYIDHHNGGVANDSLYPNGILYYVEPDGYEEFSDSLKSVVSSLADSRDVAIYNQQGTAPMTSSDAVHTHHKKGLIWEWVPNGTGKGFQTSGDVTDGVRLFTNVVYWALNYHSVGTKSVSVPAGATHAVRARNTIEFAVDTVYSGLNYVALDDSSSKFNAFRAYPGRGATTNLDSIYQSIYTDSSGLWFTDTIMPFQEIYVYSGSALDVNEDSTIFTEYLVSTGFERKSTGAVDRARKNTLSDVGISDYDTTGYIMGNGWEVSGGSEQINTNVTLSGLSNFTINMTVRQDVLDATDYFVRQTNSAGDSTFSIRSSTASSGVFFIYFGSTNLYYSYYNSDVHSAGEISTLTIVYNGSAAGSDRIKLYNDGVYVPPAGLNGTPPEQMPTMQASPLTIFLAPTALNGAIYEFSIDTGAVPNQSKITNLANQYKGVFYDLSVVPVIDTAINTSLSTITVLGSGLSISEFLMGDSLLTVDSLSGDTVAYLSSSDPMTDSSFLTALGDGNSASVLWGRYWDDTARTCIISPSTATVAPDADLQFTAVFYDTIGRVTVNHGAVSWAVDAGGSIGASTGLFTADSDTSSNNTVTATEATNSVEGTATVNVQIIEIESGRLPWNKWQNYKAWKW